MDFSFASFYIFMSVLPWVDVENSASSVVTLTSQLFVQTDRVCINGKCLQEI